MMSHGSFVNAKYVLDEGEVIYHGRLCQMLQENQGRSDSIFYGAIQISENVINYFQKSSFSTVTVHF